MAGFEKITDYSIITENLIPSRFNGKPGFNGILSSFDTQLEDLEDANYEIINDIWLDSALGVQLDLVGDILGLPRNGRDDESYRAILYLKIDINIGGGEPELVIRAVKQLYGATTVHYIPDYPAGFIVEQNGSIGLFFLTELEIDDGSFMLLDDGNPLYIREPDTTAEYLLDLVIPAGVEITIVNI